MEALEFRFAFFAGDFDRSIQFYGDTLGLQPVPDWWDRPDGKGALFVVGGTAVIEIYGAADGTAYDGPSPTAINLALRLANAEAVNSFHKRLAALNIARLQQPEDRPWGHRSFVVYDPDGIPIHIYCELK
jgi:catechol 2,3-dioxygenase-like lactoylglutathione lyase family enzyme